jgi:4-amino-4-deoxy-L-arabinose transferase-like glycosyltransferase
MFMKTSVSIAILVTLALCSFVPFASRAVYLDEPMYLHIAKSVWDHDWLFPQSTSWIFFGNLEPATSQTHPPAGVYFLAGMLKLFNGFHNIPFRLLWGIFSIIAVLAFYRLARHFTSEPLHVAALFAVSPAFFVMSPTLMMDVPMLAFFLLGFGLYLDCVQGKRARLFLVALCFVLSLGLGYPAFVPIGCLFLWAVFHKRPMAELFTIATGPVCLFLWQYSMKLHFGVVPMEKLTRHFFSNSAFPSDLLPMLSFLGGIGLFPWALLALTDLPRKWFMAGVGIVAAALLSFCHAWPSPFYRAWYIALASCGIIWILVFILKSRRRDSPRPLMQSYLILWAPAVLLFFLLMGEMISARYFLLGLPPLFLIIFAQIRRKAATVVTAATLFLAVSLAIADYRYVDSYRQWVAQTIVPLQQQGFRIWSFAESGLRFYLNQRGIQSLEKSSNLPQGGDLIVRQASFDMGFTGDLGPLLLPIKEEDIQDPFVLHVFVRSSAAGFHDSRFGMVPYCFSRSPLDRVSIAEVSPFVTHLPQVVPQDFSTVPVWFEDADHRAGVQLKQVVPEMTFRITIPPGAAVDYDLKGEGSMELSKEGITLKKLSANPAILWNNFRIIPAGFPRSLESNISAPHRH